MVSRVGNSKVHLGWLEFFTFVFADLSKLIIVMRMPNGYKVYAHHNQVLFYLLPVYSIVIVRIPTYQIIEQCLFCAKKAKRIFNRI